jgi:acyl-CoA thioesterase FadM
MTRARIDHAYTLRRGVRLLCEAKSTLACIDRAGKLIPIPDEIFHAAEQHG